MNNVAGRLEKETKFYENMKTRLQGMPKIMGEYCTSMRANRKAYTTVDVYMGYVLHFARFISDGDVSEDFYKNVNPYDIENYMISLETRETKDGVKRTGDDILQARWSGLNAFFDWCLKRGYIEKNPMGFVSRPKNNTEHKVTFLTKAEIGKLFKVVDRNPNKVIAMRDKALFSLALATGMRASALVNINKEDINWDGCFIKVIEKRQKIREIPIGQNISSILKEWINIRDEVFGNLDTTAMFISQKNGRLSPDAANDALRKYCAEAGIQKKITLHKLRSSAATSLAAAKVDIQTIGNILGHRSTATTLRYVAVLDENKKNAVGILDNLV
jgi:site-specific recombinase XerD